MYLENVCLEALLARVPRYVVILTQLEDEEGKFISPDQSEVSDLSGPIRGQYLGHVICLDQSEVRHLEIVSGRGRGYYGDPTPDSTLARAKY